MDTRVGEWVYRNAVRVLLDEQADSALYNSKARELPSYISTPDLTKHYRYIVVSRMVFEAWAAQGRIEKVTTNANSTEHEVESVWLLTPPRNGTEV